LAKLKFSAVFVSWSVLVVVLSVVSFPKPSHPPPAGIDKLVHFSLYLAFGIIAYFHPSLNWQRLGLVFIFSVALGFCLELFQIKIISRSFEWMDFFCNSLGAGFGIMISGFLWQRKGGS